MKKFALVILFFAAAILAICSRTLFWFYLGLFVALTAAIRFAELTAGDK